MELMEDQLSSEHHDEVGNLSVGLCQRGPDAVKAETGLIFLFPYHDEEGYDGNEIDQPLHPFLSA